MRTVNEIEKLEDNYLILYWSFLY